MTPTKFKPLLAATVMSAIYLAGVPTSAQATALTQLTESPTAKMQLADRQGGTDYVIPDANQDGLRRYIVQLDKEPAAGPSASSRQDTEAYVNQLIAEQNALEGAISSTLNRSVESIADYQRAYNGIALMLNEREAKIVKNMNNVKQVHLDKDYVLYTDAGPQLIGADNLWNGTNPDVGTATGEGVVVGIIDSGINFDHPSFAETDVDAYTHTNPLGAGNYLGVCDPASQQYIDYNPGGADYACNAKLIGGYDFVKGLEGGGTDIPGPEDENGHGSHTASTAAGNRWKCAF
jgi:Subtilase family.